MIAWTPDNWTQLIVSTAGVITSIATLLLSRKIHQSTNSNFTKLLTKLAESEDRERAGTERERVAGTKVDSTST